MKCTICGKELTDNYTFCPFCGNPISKDHIEEKKEITLATVLKDMIHDFGADVVLDHDRCIAFFLDMAPGLKNELLILKLALQYDIGKYFINCAEGDRKKNIRKAITAIEKNMKSETQKIIVASFVYAFGWEEIELQSFFQEVIEPKDKKGNSLLQNNGNNNEEAELYYGEGEMYYYGYGVDKSYARAKYYYQKAAEQGHVEAQAKLGDLYHNGEGVATDPVKAAEWHRKAAEQGYAKSQYYLGNMCYNKNDYVKAAEWYQKAADGGLVNAQYRLGVMYFNGKLLAKNYEMALDLFKKAESQGNMYATYYLGLMYENGWGVVRNNKTAKIYYENAIKRGYKDAKKNLDVIEKIIYEESIVDPEMQYQEGKKYYDANDYINAVKWYLKAAGQGHAEAQWSLGYVFYYGKGVEIDSVKAAEWCRKAAEQGYAKAQNSLGVCYEYNKGVALDYKKAAEWYKKACDQGEMRAAWNLGRMYEYGKGVNEDIEAAKQYYGIAAEQGDADAKKKLEKIIHDERIVDPEKQYQEGEKYYNANDYRNAVKWYLKAARQGHLEAQWSLGYVFYHGKGVEIDYVKAVEWYRKAAEQGYAKAQNSLGICYENNKGVALDYKIAAEWYKKACDQGEMHAAWNLGLMYENGKGVNEDIEAAKRYYGIAAEQGDADAKEKLEKIIHDERIVDPKMQYQEGEKYYNAKDYKNAVKWYLKAAEQGHAKALNKLGECYKNGEGVTKDYVKALEWFQKADKQGDKDATYYLALIYKGDFDGFPKDYSIATHYFIKAAERGHKDARYKLQCLRRAEKYTNARIEDTDIKNMIGVIGNIEDKIKYLRQSFNDDFWRTYNKMIAVLDLISPKKARNVIKSYAKNTGIKDSDIKVMFDNSFFGSGDKGFIITEKYLISNSSYGKELILLRDILHLKVKNYNTVAIVYAVLLNENLGDENSRQQSKAITSFTNKKSDIYHLGFLKKINEIIFNWYE